MGRAAEPGPAAIDDPSQPSSSCWHWDQNSLNSARAPRAAPRPAGGRSTSGAPLVKTYAGRPGRPGPGRRPTINLLAAADPASGRECRGQLRLAAAARRAGRAARGPRNEAAHCASPLIIRRRGRGALTAARRLCGRESLITSRAQIPSNNGSGTAALPKFGETCFIPMADQQPAKSSRRPQ